MLMKEIPCHVCNGHGFICKTSENKAWSEFCLYCHGTGIEKVPMTNADRIRTMNDDELSVFLWNFRLEDVATGKVGDFGPHMFRRRLKEWLQQPAEEG